MTNLSSVKALTFDVFGTVVDWRGSIIQEGEVWGDEQNLNVDWPAFADAWRAGYGPSMQKVRSGALPWTNIDGLHRMILDDLLIQFGITGLTEVEIDQINRVWHRLQPWPDALGGLTRLREGYITATLSNGNVALLTNMAKNASLPWDCILSAELVGQYKPDAEVYQTAANLLGLAPSEVMMVAAHNNDLQAAQAIGFKTAFVLRATEYGPDQSSDLIAGPTVDVVAEDFNDLANQLGLP